VQREDGSSIHTARPNAGRQSHRPARAA